MTPYPRRQAGVNFIHPFETWTLTLNSYQRDNLLHLLNGIGYPYDNPHRNPDLAPYNSGDWVGEISYMLGKVVPDPDYRETATYVIDGEDRPNPVRGCPGCG